MSRWYIVRGKDRWGYRYVEAGTRDPRSGTSCGYDYRLRATFGYPVRVELNMSMSYLTVGPLWLEWNP